MKYERITGQEWSENIDLKQELGYSYIYKRLHELEDKIEQGTLIELPCTVGDTVYFAVDNGWDCAEIDEIHIFENDIVFEWVQYDRGYELTELWDSGDFSLKDIGKTVFLTREQAEAKLMELQNG